MPVASAVTEYTFHGEGITASYFPGGAGGPIVQGMPEVFFSYHDRHQSTEFGQEGVTVQHIENVGALVSVTLAEGELAGSPVTTFTVLVPAVGVAPGSPQSFRTKSITTVQAASYAERQVFPQLQTYKVETLDGAASVHPLPA